MKDKFLSVLRYLEGMFRDVILLMLESAVSKTECLCIQSWIKWEKRTNKQIPLPHREFVDETLCDVGGKCPGGLIKDNY